MMKFKTFGWEHPIKRTKKYRADKQTDNQTHTDKQTDAAENIDLASVRYVVG